MSHVLSMFLDVVVLVFLGVTIYYAMKLSKSSNNFRRYRGELDKLLDELTRNIDEAQRAIHNLKISSGDAGKGLDKVVREARTLIRELQIINESGRALAERLDGAVERNRPAATRAAVKISPPVQRDEERTFAIRDRDPDTAAWPEDQEDADIPEYLQSQAEQELYKALRKGKKMTGGRA